MNENSDSYYKRKTFVTILGITAVFAITKRGDIPLFLK